MKLSLHIYYNSRFQFCPASMLLQLGLALLVGPWNQFAENTQPLTGTCAILPPITLVFTENSKIASGLVTVGIGVNYQSQWHNGCERGRARKGHRETGDEGENTTVKWGSMSTFNKELTKNGGKPFIRLFGFSLRDHHIMKFATSKNENQHGR